MSWRGVGQTVSASLLCCLLAALGLDGAGLKKAMSAAAMVLARANESDRSLTLKRIRSKSVEVTMEHRLLDQITPQDPPIAKLLVESPTVSCHLTAIALQHTRTRHCVVDESCTTGIEFASTSSFGHRSLLRVTDTAAPAS